MLLKGEGGDSDNIVYGSTLANDGFPSRQFDFMLSNPPYGKSWKNDADKLGGKKDIQDTRFVTSFAGNGDFGMIPRTSDGQLLFLLNNVSKMKEQTELGSRIAEVHNGSSLFTGDAGQGESNARRYLIERDLVEAIIALPENMFYNTHMATYIWVLSNRKDEKRRGKIQLINATKFKVTLKKNLGKKNCEITGTDKEQIVRLFVNMEETADSIILLNSDFGYHKIPLLFPERDGNGEIIKDKKGHPKHDTALTDYEKVPFNYPGGIEAYLINEVRPFSADSWFDTKNMKIGYEIRFTKYFKQETDRANLPVIEQKIQSLETVLARQLDFIKQLPYAEYSALDESWIYELPSHWKAVKFKYLFDERVEKGYPNEPLLAATQNMGVVPKDVYGQRTVEASKDFHLLKLVKVDDFVISLRSFQGGIEKAYYQGIISPAYTILKCKGIRKEYFKHLAKSPVFVELLKQCVTGIREGQNVDYGTLKNIRIPVPPEDEQIQIAAFLDSIDARIDARIKEINLLKKYKRTIMSDVVTGKLDVRGVAVPEYDVADAVVDEELPTDEEIGEEDGENGEE
jgi:type I restriction enzyme M protein